jgi:hypothetical protein
MLIFFLCSKRPEVFCTTELFFFDDGQRFSPAHTVSTKVPLRQTVEFVEIRFSALCIVFSFFQMNRPPSKHILEIAIRLLHGAKILVRCFQTHATVLTTKWSFTHNLKQWAQQHRTFIMIV